MKNHSYSEPLVRQTPKTLKGIPVFQHRAITNFDNDDPESL